jgi:hypothetical protein
VKAKGGATGSMAPSLALRVCADAFSKLRRSLERHRRAIQKTLSILLPVAGVLINIALYMAIFGGSHRTVRLSVTPQAPRVLETSPAPGRQPHASEGVPAHPRGPLPRLPEVGASVLLPLSAGGFLLVALHLKHRQQKSKGE